MIDLMENKILGPAIRQGLEQGRREGRTEGMATVLRKRLAKRFGLIPSWAESKIATASPELLELWSLRLDENPSLENLFA